MKDIISKSEKILYLSLENEFGILERIIGIFSLRGFKILSMKYFQNNESGFFELKITVKCTQNEIEKLIKIIEKQIHVVEIEQLSCESSEFAGIA